jgi:hypothetical protein
MKFAKKATAYLPQEGYDPKRILPCFDGELVTLMIEKKRRYNQRRRIRIDEVKNEDGQPTGEPVVVAVDKVRYYYKEAEWPSCKVSGRGCTCPCEPNCWSNPHYQEDWSTDDEEGARGFYGDGDSPNHYKKLGTQDLRTGKLTTNRVDDYPNPWPQPINPTDYYVKMVVDDKDDWPWEEEEDRTPNCVSCKESPCLWVTHRHALLSYVATSTGNEEVNETNLLELTRDRKERRWLAYRHASRLIRGFMGKGKRHKHAECVELGIKRTYPDPKGEAVGYKSA